MLTYLTRNKLASFLLAVNEGERQIEIIRQILCEQEDFEPYAAFKRIDRHKRGVLNAVDIKNFLEDNKVNFSELDCDIFVQRYDANGDGQLSYSEFLQGVLTLDNTVLRTVTTQRKNYDVGNGYLPYDIEYALSKVIAKEIEFYINLDAKKEELLNFHDFNYANAFAAIDKASCGTINYDNLRTFFKGQSIYPGDDEIIPMLRRLDKNDDGLITFDEFVASLEPISIILRSIANRRNASGGLVSPTKTSGRREASPTRRTASPSRRGGSPSRAENFTQSVSFASPEKRVGYPPRSGGSPLRKEASPYRKEASPRRREASPIRKEASPIKEAAQSLARRMEELENSLRTSSPLRVTSPVKNHKGQTSALESTIEGTASSSLRKSQIYKDFSRTQSKSPIRNASRQTLQTPEKGASVRSQHNSTQKNIKKTLNFDENVSHYILIQTLKQFIVLDKDLETSKQDLTLKSDFNLLDFFRTFDITNHGAVSCRELEAGLIKYGIYPNKEELHLLFKRLDVDNDNLLRFSDFAETFTPRQKEYANLLHNRNANTNESIVEVYKV